MNEKILNHVKTYNVSQGYGISEDDCIETIKESKVVWKDSGDKHRWYILYNYVVEVNGMFIGYREAENTGDGETGYEFKPSTIHECRPVEKTVIVYEPVS